MMRASFVGDRDVGEQPADEAGADRRAAHGADDRLRAVDQVVDEVPRLLPVARARVEVVDDALDHVEVAAGGERLARTPKHGRGHALVRVDVAPHRLELAVHLLVGGIQPARARHGDAEHAGMRPVELKTLVVGVTIGHGALPGCESGGSRGRPAIRGNAWSISRHVAPSREKNPRRSTASFHRIRAAMLAS